MSMYDKCYCSSNCIRKNCERNLNYHKPGYRIYSVSDLDSESVNEKHIRCKYFSPIGEDIWEEE